MPIDATWETGARNDAWDELWRRLLASVFEDDDRADEEHEHDTDDGDVGASES